LVAVEVDPETKVAEILKQVAAKHQWEPVETLLSLEGNLSVFRDVHVRNLSGPFGGEVHWFDPLGAYVDGAAVPLVRLLLLGLAYRVLVTEYAMHPCCKSVLNGNLMCRIYR
jgi:hypothetical protein